MQKTLIKTSLKPSKLAYISHLALLFLAMVYVVWLKSLAVALILLGLALWLSYRYFSSNTLLEIECKQDGSKVRWAIRYSPAGLSGLEVDSDRYGWHVAKVRVIRVGPWLSAMRIDGETVWIWPDSTDKYSQRKLFRCLLANQLV